jgi:O-antigen/teichoic acid export membrane protein
MGFRPSAAGTALEHTHSQGCLASTSEDFGERGVFTVTSQYLREVLRARLVAGSIAVLVVRFVNVFAALLLSVLLLRMLGLAGFGTLAAVQAVVAVGVIPMTSGLPNLIVKEVSTAFSSGDVERVRGLIHFVASVIAAYVAAVSLVVIAALPLITERASLSLIGALWLLAVLQILAAVRSAVLRAAGQVVKGQLLERLFQPVLSVIFVSLIYLVGDEGFGVEQAVNALVLAHILTLASGGFWIRRYAVTPGRRARVDKGELLREAGRLSGSSFLSSGLVNGVVLMTAGLASIEAAGIYRVASAVTQPLIYVHEVLGQVVSPRLAQSWSKGDRASVSRILKVGVAASFASVALGILLLLTIGPWLIKVAYGIEGGALMTVVAILALAHLANASGGFDHELLNMTGNSKATLKWSVILIPALLLAAFPLISYSGGRGAALCMLIYQALATFLVASETVRMTGINPSIVCVFRRSH